MRKPKQRVNKKPRAFKVDDVTERNQPWDAGKEAVDGEPEPMYFEHVPVEKTPFDKIADRVLSAVHELNASLEEANACAEMRVFLGSHKDEGKSMRFEASVYRLTHETMTFSIHPKMEWRHVKDPAARDAAGQGLNALRARAEDDGVFAKGNLGTTDD